MRPLLIGVVTAVFLSGCAAVWPTTHDTLYFHESKDGTRYYALASDWTLRSPRNEDSWQVPEGMLWVTREGEVYTSRGQLTPSVTKREGGDWDLWAYPVEPPSGYCVPLWSPAISRPESCWNRLWEVPSMFWLVVIPLVVLLP